MRLWGGDLELPSTLGRDRNTCDADAGERGLFCLLYEFMNAKIFVLTILAPICLQAGQVFTIYDEDKNLSRELITEYIEWAGPFIRQYPPRFQSEEHQKKIFASSLMILGDIKKIDPSQLEDAPLLADLAYILSMGHNIHMGTADLSKRFFERSLEIDPESQKANYLMGMFLAGTRKYQFDSIPYLEKALELGEVDAQFTLGLLAVNQGDRMRGLEMLKAYSKSHPDNDHVVKVIEAIEKEELEFRTSDSQVLELKVGKGGAKKPVISKPQASE